MTPAERPTLQQTVSAPAYAERVAAAVERVAAAGEPAGALHRLSLAVATLGAERAVFASVERHQSDIAAVRFMLACEPGGCRLDLHDGAFVHDPWLAYAAQHTEPIVASTLHAGVPGSSGAIARASAGGFASAVLVPAHTGPGHARISVLALGSSQPGYFEAEGFGRFRLGARALAAELHDWWIARLRRELVSQARITEVDLALLRLERQGHGSKRIASALCISTSAVDSRFQRINARLGVPNRRAAARLAVECGLLPF